VLLLARELDLSTSLSGALSAAARDSRAGS
jgi:hypothetical protein